MNAPFFAPHFCTFLHRVYRTNPLNLTVSMRRAVFLLLVMRRTLPQSQLTVNHRPFSEGVSIYWPCYQQREKDKPP